MFTAAERFLSDEIRSGSTMLNGLHSHTFARIVSSELIGFLSLVFPYFFVSVPCARLRWPFCQLLSARKYIASYRNQMRYLPSAKACWQAVKLCQCITKRGQREQLSSCPRAQQARGANQPHQKYFCD